MRDPVYWGLDRKRWDCSGWRLAADGRTFYTVAGDQYNCPIGSYTHNIALPPERAPELEQTLSLMGTLGYVKMEEVPGILRLPEPPGAVVYAPLRAGVMANATLLPRPTCMALLPPRRRRAWSPVRAASATVSCPV
jgi:hypothetical protein